MEEATQIDDDRVWHWLLCLFEIEERFSVFCGSCERSLRLTKVSNCLTGFHYSCRSLDKRFLVSSVAFNISPRRHEIAQTCLRLMRPPGRWAGISTRESDCCTVLTSDRTSHDRTPMNARLALLSMPWHDCDRLSRFLLLEACLRHLTLVLNEPAAEWLANGALEPVAFMRFLAWAKYKTHPKSSKHKIIS